MGRENLQVPGVSWMTLKGELSALEYRLCQQLARTEADKTNRSGRSLVLGRILREDFLE